MSSTRRSSRRKEKSNVLKATEEERRSPLDRNKRGSPAVEQEINKPRTRNKGISEPSSSLTTRRKDYNIDEVRLLGSRRGKNQTDHREKDSPTSKTRAAKNVQSPKINLDNLETRRKTRSTPKTTEIDRPTPRSRRVTRRTKGAVRQEPEDESQQGTDGVKITEESEVMARSRTPGFNDTPKHLYGLDDTKEVSSGEDEICVVDSDDNNNTPKKPSLIKCFLKRPRWDCKYICFTSFIVFILIAVISALLQPHPPDIPVVQFSKEPLREQDTAAWNNKNLRELQAKLEQISAQVNNLRTSIKDETQKKMTDEVIMSKQNLAHYIESLIQDKMEEALDVYSADKLGIPDYALESAGGQIHDHYHSPTYETGTSRKLFGFSLWYDGVPPRVILQPDNTPGSCWAFQGQEGYVVIELSQAIIPEMFTLEHIPSSLSTDQHGKIPSAPKDFSVWGWLDNEGNNRRLLGEYTYNDHGKSLQTFKVDQEKCSKDYKYIELRVKSNHGDQTHTCIYRFRVHGKPPPGPALLASKELIDNPPEKQLKQKAS